MDGSSFSEKPTIPATTIGQLSSKRAPIKGTSEHVGQNLCNPWRRGEFWHSRSPLFARARRSEKGGRHRPQSAEIRMLHVGRRRRRSALQLSCLSREL